MVDSIKPSGLLPSVATAKIEPAKIKKNETPHIGEGVSDHIHISSEALSLQQAAQTARQTAQILKDQTEATLSGQNSDGLKAIS